MQIADKALYNALLQDQGVCKSDWKHNERFENTIVLAKCLLLSTGNVVPTIVAFQRDGSVFQIHPAFNDQPKIDLSDLLAPYDLKEVHFFHRYIVGPGIGDVQIVHDIPNCDKLNGQELFLVMAIAPDYKWRSHCRIIRGEGGQIECLGLFARHESRNISQYKHLFHGQNNRFWEEHKPLLPQPLSLRVNFNYESELRAMKQFEDCRGEHIYTLAVVAEMALRKVHELPYDIETLGNLPEDEWGKVLLPCGRVAFIGTIEAGSYYYFPPNVGKDDFEAENTFAILVSIKGASEGGVTVHPVASAPSKIILSNAEYRDFGIGPQLSIHRDDPGLEVYKPDQERH